MIIIGNRKKQVWNSNDRRNRSESQTLENHRSKTKARFVEISEDCYEPIRAETREKTSVWRELR